MLNGNIQGIRTTSWIELLFQFGGMRKWTSTMLWDSSLLIQKVAICTRSVIGQINRRILDVGGPHSWVYFCPCTYPQHYCAVVRRCIMNRETWSGFQRVQWMTAYKTDVHIWALSHKKTEFKKSRRKSKLRLVCKIQGQTVFAICGRLWSSRLWPLLANSFAG